MKSGDKNFNLEERLINFSVSILNLIENMPQSLGAVGLSKQLARSGTSPALNYGEAQAAESGKDFLHKMKICLKEFPVLSSLLHFTFIILHLSFQYSMSNRTLQAFFWGTIFIF